MNQEGSNLFLSYLNFDYNGTYITDQYLDESGRFEVVPVEYYGETLYLMSPREAIDLGKMIRPRLHIVKTEGVYNTDDYDKSLSKIIYESFLQHEEVIKNNDLKPKILISVKGTQDISTFLESDEYSRLKKNNVEIFAVASHEDIGNDANGDDVSRQEFLKRLKIVGKDNNKSLIVLHYDILAEGIDVSGFTGIMPLRSLKKSKFLQTFGRGARLDTRDRINLENGLFKPDELDKFNKPYAYIIIPNVIQNNNDDKANIIQLITELRDYGFNPSEDIISSTLIKGIPEIDELDGLNDIKIKLPNIGEYIEDLEADIESKVNANLSKLDYLNKMIKENKL